MITIRSATRRGIRPPPPRSRKALDTDEDEEEDENEEDGEDKRNARDQHQGFSSTYFRTLEQPCRSRAVCLAHDPKADHRLILIDILLNSGYQRAEFSNKLYVPIANSKGSEPTSGNRSEAGRESPRTKRAERSSDQRPDRLELSLRSRFQQRRRGCEGPGIHERNL